MSGPSYCHLKRMWVGQALWLVKNLTALRMQILLTMSKRQKSKRAAQKRIVRASKSGSFGSRQSSSLKHDKNIRYSKQSWCPYYISPFSRNSLVLRDSWTSARLECKATDLLCRLEKQGSLQSNTSNKSGLIKSFLPGIARSFSGIRGFKTAGLRYDETSRGHNKQQKTVCKLRCMTYRTDSITDFSLMMG